MAEEYGLANLLAGQSIPADDSGLGQIYGGGDSYTAQPQAPSSATAIPPGYRPVPLPNGGFVFAYKDHTDEQAIAAYQAAQGAQHPQHKPIPHGHAAAREPVAPEFKQAQREPRYEAFDPITEVLNAENQLDRASIEEIPRAYKYALTPAQAAQVKRQEEKAALAAQPRDPEKQGFIPAVGAGFAREIGSVGRFASESAQPFAPGVAQTIKEVTQPAEAKAKELHQPISDIEIAEAKQKGFVPYAGAQLTRAGDILGGFDGEWGVPGIVSRAGAPGRAISGGLTFAQLYGDLSRRAEESGVELSLPEKYAGAAISTAIFQLAPNFVTKGLPLNVLAPSAKAIVDIYEKEGAEAAQKAVGSLAGNIVKSYGSGVVGGTAAMAGTEAVTRHMLGQPQITPEETLEMAKDAAIISAPMSILHGRAATAEAQKGYREGAARAYREDQRLQQQVDAINQENAERTWPEMRTEGQRADQTQGTEHIETPGVAEPAPPTGEINLLQPVDWHPTGDGFPNTVEGLKGFIAHHKDKLQNEVARRNPEVAAPIEGALKEANKRLTALRRTAQKGEAPTPPGIPPSAELLPWPGEAPPEAVTPEAPVVTPEAPPPVEAVTPEAPAAPWPVEALGLKPNAALTKRLAKLDMNNPEHIEAISDELNKTRVQIEPEKLAALSNHFDAIIKPSKTTEQKAYGAQGEQNIIPKRPPTVDLGTQRKTTELFSPEAQRGMELLTQRIQDVARSYTEEGRNPAQELLRQTIPTQKLQQDILGHLDTLGETVRASGDYGAVAREIITEIGARSPQGRGRLEQLTRKLGASEQQRPRERAPSLTSREMGQEPRGVLEMPQQGAKAPSERLMHEVLPTKQAGEIDALNKQISSTPDGGSGAQPVFREEGGDQAVSGQGVEPSGQGEQAAEVEAPKEVEAIQQEARSLQPGDIIANDMGDRVEIVKLGGTLKDGTQLYEWRDPDDPNFGPTKMATSSPEGSEGVLSIHTLLSPYQYLTPEGERKSAPGATITRAQEAPKTEEELTAVEPQNPREAWEAMRSEGDPDHKALPREAQIAWKRAFDDGAADKAFFDQLKTAITPEADRQAGETEEAVAPSKKDYDGDEFLYSRGEKPKEATSREMIHETIKNITGDKPTAWSVKIHDTVEDAQNHLNEAVYEKLDRDYPAIMRAIDHFERTGELDPNDPYLPRGGVVSRERHIDILRGIASDIRKNAEAKGLTGLKLEPDARGFVLGNKAHFVVENIPKGRELGVMLHEVGDHLGMEKLLGTEQRSRLAAKVADWAKTHKGLEGDVARAAIERSRGDESEHIAYFVEEAVNHGVDPTAWKPNSGFSVWFRQLLAAFKAGLRKLGIKNVDRLSAQDIVDMAYGAAHLELRSRWHGAPKDFRKFQLKYRGTGEGGLEPGDRNAEHFTDMIGWGHYMSGRRGIAEEYRDRLSAQAKRGTGALDLKDYKKDFDVGTDKATAFSDAYEILHETRGDFIKARRRIGLHAQEFTDALNGVWPTPKNLPDLIKQAEKERDLALQFIDTFEKHGAEYIPGEQPEPTLYKLGINAFDHELIDWEKPLSEQSPDVQRVANRVKKKLEKEGVLDDVVDTLNSNWEDISGRDFYRYVMRKARDTDAIPELYDLSAVNAEKAASEYLDSQGIKGIKYPTQGGQGPGHNYVIFSDKNVHIAGKNVPRTEAEGIRYSRAPEGEEERPPLTKIDRSSTLKTIAKTLKRAALAVSDPSAMSEEYAKFRRRVIAESAGLTKALENEPTYDPDTGIRVDYLRNQYDSAYQLSLEGLFNGVPVLEPKTGVVRIQPTTRTNLDRIMADAAKLPLKVSYDGQKKEPLEVMADIFRIKMGEQELKEYEEAKVKLRAIEQLPEATRNQTDTKAEMDRLKELITNQERGIGRERNVTREDIRWANDEIQHVPGVQDILDRWGETNQELLRFARDTNWITPEKYEEWSERPSYIPMYKPMEDILAERDETPAFPGGGPKTVGKLFGKTGAASAFPVNVFESLSQHYTSMITNSMMNNVKYRAFQQLERVGLAERVAPTYKGKDAVKARAAGKDFLYKVKDEEAFRSLTMANMYSNPFLDLVAIPANVVRRTALFLNPAYYYRTMIHDPLAATLTTTAKGAIGPVTPADALYQIGKRAAGFDKSAKDLQYYGISGLANMDANMHRFARALGDSPKYNKWLQYIDKVHSSFDDATRTIVYEAAKKEAAKDGITDPQVINDIAAVKARDFADFAAKGSSQLVRIAGKQTPFLHAHFVGLDKMLRSATGHGKDSKEGKAQRDRFVAGATLAASAVVAITLANIRDKRYRDLPIGEWSKNIIAGFDDEGRAIKIPVPQEIGFWFKFVPELMTRMLMGVSDKPEASKAFHGMAIDTLLPPGLADPISIAVRGWLQMQTNTELHSGLPIESPQEQLLLPEDRDKRATIFSKALRDQLKKYGLSEDFSPDKFDSFMRSYLTTIWDNSALAATMIHDAYTGKRSLFELPFNKDFTEVYPGAKAFFSNPRNISATPRFYDMAKPLYETLKSVNAAAHGEMDDSVERFDELRNDPVVMQRYRMAKVAAKYRSKISALEKAIEQLDNRQDLTEAQRRKLYWDRIKDRNELARTAVNELSKGLMQDKKFKDDVEKSWKLSVSPEDLEREIGKFKENTGDTEE